MMLVLLKAVIDGFGGMPEVQPLHDEIKVMLQEIEEKLSKRRERQAGR